MCFSPLSLSYTPSVFSPSAELSNDLYDEKRSDFTVLLNKTKNGTIHGRS